MLGDRVHPRDEFGHAIAGRHRGVRSRQALVGLAAEYQRVGAEQQLVVERVAVRTVQVRPAPVLRGGDVTAERDERGLDERAHYFTTANRRAVTEPEWMLEIGSRSTLPSPSTAAYSGVPAEQHWQNEHVDLVDQPARQALAAHARAQDDQVLGSGRRLGRGHRRADVAGKERQVARTRPSAAGASARSSGRATRRHTPRRSACRCPAARPRSSCGRTVSPGRLHDLGEVVRSAVLEDPVHSVPGPAMKPSSDIAAWITALPVPRRCRYSSAPS